MDGGVAEAQALLARPEVFFSQTGAMPERVALTFGVPAAFDSPDAFRDAVHARLSALEREAAADLAAQGRRVLGLRGLRKQQHTDRPAPGEPRRRLNPRVACKDEEKRREALGRLVQFRSAYRAALQRLREGARRVVFPSGTYLLRVHLGIACAAA